MCCTCADRMTAASSTTCTQQRRGAWCVCPEKDLEGDETVCSCCSLRDSGGRRWGGRKSQNCSSVCRRWVRRWAIIYTKHAVRQMRRGQKKDVFYRKSCYLDSAALWKNETKAVKNAGKENAFRRCREMEKRAGVKGRRLNIQFMY